MMKIARVLSGRRFTVFFSGGKDSLATLLWIVDNVPDIRGMRIIYAEVTGNTHRLCNHYVHNVIKALGLEEHFVHVKRKDKTFWDFLHEIGPPLLLPSRWCLNEMKRKAWRPYISGLFAVIGLRAEESYHRSKARQFMRTSNGQLTILPILSWTREQVLDYIREHGFWLNPCYRRYGHSGNCMFCPYHRREYIIRTLADPEWRLKIISALNACRIGGPIQARLRDRWLRLAKQTTLEVAAA